MNDFLESDMFPKVKEYFEHMGYRVNCEVKGCDMVAEKPMEKGEKLTAIEFKKSFNAKLLFQAIDRQRFADAVYIVIPAPRRKNDKNISKIKHIAQKLNLGLICVAMDSEIKYIDILNQPNENLQPRNNSRKRFVSAEAKGRSLDLNKAGAVKEKIATAYRERCIQMACALYYEKESSAKSIINKYGFDEKYSQIFLSNYYGWFDRVKTGVYSLSDTAILEMENGGFKSLFDAYLEKYKEQIHE